MHRMGDSYDGKGAVMLTLRCCECEWGMGVSALLPVSTQKNE